ncbi:MAG TPA: SDR family oxidoreductase [Anaerolineaceae bacterium]|nr:SDR family oxidoreductase [Anaerolineaceae bacterium]HPD63592.1 SDR family oxidoreductase [Anaerolineaceae bacterium]HRS75112.1 SDR family oxidoreductase [Anaerolineaceae bacterium]
MKENKRVVLITGSAGGIGKACVELFAANGWQVVGIDVNAFGLGFPADGLYIQADISQPDEFPVLFEKVKAFSARLHALVNNAAVQVSKPLIETTVEEWDKVIATNLRPVFLSAREFHPLLINAGSSAIVNMSSVHAIQTSASISAYAASKGGMLALTRAMAIEFAKDNIRVNAVLPGAVDTPMLRSGLDRGHVTGPSLNERLDNLARKTVNGRIGQPAEIARAVYFLADGTQSSFMTGQALVVDGGATARLSTE